MRSLGFDHLAHVYDRTRTIDPTALEHALVDISERFPPARYQDLLDAGTGTGRLAVPLAQRGYQVLGVDISRPMLTRFQAKADASAVQVRVGIALADVGALPLKDTTFSISLATHLFYFVSRWKEAARELIRVTKPGGAILLLHTGTGREAPKLHDRYRAVSRELGCDLRSVGVTGVGVESTREVLAFYTSEGLEVERRAGEWLWTERIPFQEALDNLSERAYSFTTAVPGEIHREIMARLREEMAAVPPGREPCFEVPNAVSLSIVRRG